VVDCGCMFVVDSTICDVGRSLLQLTGRIKGKEGRGLKQRYVCFLCAKFSRVMNQNSMMLQRVQSF
jgi:hypothetical protein